MPNPNPAKQFCAICAIERNIHEHPTFIGDHSFVAKLASTEIAQSRERFEKAREDFAAPYLDLHSRSIARAAFMAGWSEAERDTRERMAQLAVQHAQDWRPCTCGFEDGKNYKTECGHAINCSMYHAINLAERIRGKV